METITNLANTAVGTASKLIYGDQTTKTEEAVDATKHNETAGKEPVSGVEGKGTATQPFDQGNARKSPIPGRCCRSGWTSVMQRDAAGRVWSLLGDTATTLSCEGFVVLYLAFAATEQHATC
jgi:hypothetical protein